MARIAPELLLAAIPIIHKLLSDKNLKFGLGLVHLYLDNSDGWSQSTDKLDRIATLLSGILSEPFLRDQLSSVQVISSAVIPTQDTPSDNAALTLLCELVATGKAELVSAQAFRSNSQEVQHIRSELLSVLVSYQYDQRALENAEDIGSGSEIPRDYPWYNFDGDNFQYGFDDFPFGGNSSIRSLALNLYEALHQHSSCSCGADHDGKLGSSAGAMLRLESQWLSEHHIADGFFVIFTVTDTGQESRIRIFGERMPEDTEMRACQIEMPVFSDDDDLICLTLQSDVDKCLWVQQHLCEATQILVANPELESSVNVRTLREVLLSMELIPFAMKLVLAVKLARTLLHLFEGQWMPGQWSSEDVLFSCRQLDSGHMVPLLQHPFVFTAFGVDTNPTPNRRRGFRKLPALCARDSTGILRSTKRDYKFGEQLLKEAKLVLGADSAYLKPVEFCISKDGFIGMNKVAVSNPVFIKTYYKRVVAPLEVQLKKGSQWSWPEIQALQPSMQPDSDAILSFVPRSYQEPTPSLPRQPQARNVLPIVQEDNELNDNREDIHNLLLSEAFDTLTSSSVSADQVRLSRIWFKRLENSHIYLNAARTYTELRPKDKKKLIRVAVLDTGIDLTHPLIKSFADKGQIPDYWDYITGTKEITDPVGHGTFVSHVLFKTAPYTMLYPMRVFRNQYAEANTAALVKKAIQDAIAKWNVDIISMSFSLKDDDYELQSEIQKHTDKVLFFAAASNNKRGESLRDIGFPARIKGKVICVNSGEYNGDKSSFSPRGRLGRANISVIGEGIEAAWPLALDRETRLAVLSGTSCSTPIAAGLAALILDVANQTVEEKVERPQALKEVKVMERIMLKNMSRDYRDAEYNHLTPFEFFDRELVELVKGINQTIETVDDD